MWASLLDQADDPLLRGHMADQVDVIVQVAYEVLRDVVSGSPSVPDELPL